MVEVSRTRVLKYRSPAKPRLTKRRKDPGYTPPAAPYRVRGGVLLNGQTAHVRNKY